MLPSLRVSTSNASTVLLFPYDSSLPNNPGSHDFTTPFNFFYETTPKSFGNNNQLIVLSLAQISQQQLVSHLYKDADIQETVDVNYACDDVPADFEL